MIGGSENGGKFQEGDGGDNGLDAAGKKKLEKGGTAFDFVRLVIEKSEQYIGVDANGH